MRTLILRTFAHSNIWEGNEESCHFDFTQKDQILKWEPDFLSFKINDFDNAIGIYTEKYFTGYYEPLTSIRKIANTGSLNEQIISQIILSGNQGFVSQLLKNSIHINISLGRKLWNRPDKILMFKIDEIFINEKEKELKRNNIKAIQSKFKPLSFSLDSEIVNNILTIMNHQ